MLFEHEYPYSNFHEMNLDYMLRMIKTLEEKIKVFTSVNEIKYAVPFMWSIVNQYEQNTLTQTDDGAVYLSKKAVPASVSITNEEYWLKVADFSVEYRYIMDAIAAANEGSSTTATAPRAVGDYVWLSFKLYEVIAPMIAGDTYVVDSNVKHITIEEALKAIKNDIIDIDGNMTSLQEEIDDIKERIVDITDDSVQLYFVESGEGSPNGACVIAKCNDKVVVMDAGTEAGGIAIGNWMVANGVTHIDYFVISHYHIDHVGGFSGIVSNPGINVEGCKLYLPHSDIDISRMVVPEGQSFDWIIERQNNVIQTANTLGMTVFYPAENQQVNVSNSINLVFNNLLVSEFIQYYPYTKNYLDVEYGQTEYNNFSMVTTLTNGHKKFVYTADIEHPACDNMAVIVRNADVVTAPHHGLNVNLGSTYVENLTPSAYVVPVGATRYNSEVYFKPDILRAVTQGAQTFITYYSKVLRVDMMSDDINGYCSGEQYSMAAAHSLLDFGMVLSDPIDFNDLIEVGTYEIKNQTSMQACTNTPFTYSGAKIIVSAVNEGGTIMQTAITTTSADIATFTRKKVGAEWTPWKGMHASTSYTKYLTASDFIRNVTPAASTDTIRPNYINVKNGFLTVALDITTNEQCPTNQPLMRIPDITESVNSDHGLFVSGDTNPTIYPYQIYRTTYNGVEGYYIYPRGKAIPAGTRIWTTNGRLALYERS